MGQNLTSGRSYDFLGKATPAPREKTAKLAESSETTVQRNSLRGRDPRVVRRRTSVQLPKTVQRTTQVRGLLQIQMESIMADL
jgi:hypothetical protein